MFFCNGTVHKYLYYCKEQNIDKRGLIFKFPKSISESIDCCEETIYNNSTSHPVSNPRLQQDVQVAQFERVCRFYVNCTEYNKFLLQ